MTGLDFDPAHVPTWVSEESTEKLEGLLGQAYREQRVTTIKVKGGKLLSTEIMSWDNSTVTFRILDNDQIMTRGFVALSEVVLTLRSTNTLDKARFTASIERERTSIGQLVREERQRSGLTQAQLGRETGVSANYISNIENGSAIPTNSDTIRKLADALHVSDYEVFAAAQRVPDDVLEYLSGNAEAIKRVREMQEFTERRHDQKPE